MAIQADGWKEWGKHVLSELERLEGSLQRTHATCSECREKRSAEVMKLNVAVGKLNVKASIWGFIGGVLAAVLPFLINMLK